MSKVLRSCADLSVAVLLAAALLLVSRFDQRRVASDPSRSARDDSGAGTTRTTKAAKLPPEPLRLAVTQAHFDDMGKLLQTLGAGYQYEVIEESALDDPAVRSRFDVVFLTCAKAERPAEGSRERLKESLRAFVGNGGTLYASDLRFDDLAAAFPEFVELTAVAQGTQQDLRAEVVDPALRAVLGPAMPLHFDLEGWRPAAFDGRSVTVYLKGKLQTTAGIAIEAPLLVKFPYRDGNVLFTSFHNEKQNSTSETALLKHLVLTTVTARVESRITRTMISGGFAPQQRNLLSATPDNPSITSVYDHPEPGALQFVLGFDGRGAELRLEVTSPDNRQFVKRGDSTLTLDVPGAAAGRWRYRMIAEKLPYPNFPFTLTVGAVTTEQVATARGSLAASSPAQPANPSGSSGVSSGTVSFKVIELARQPRQVVKERRLAVTPPLYDDMGKLLDTLGSGYQYEKLSFAGLLDPATMARFDVIFLTCNGVPEEWSGKDSTNRSTQRPELTFGTYNRVTFDRVCENLRQFVRQGGTLYASDLCYRYVGPAFPEFEDRANDELRAQRLRVLEEAEQEQFDLLIPTAKIETVTQVLKNVRLSKSLADEIDRIVAALEGANLTESFTLTRTDLAEAMKKVELPPLDSDVDAIATALNNRALMVNRSLAKARKKVKPSRLNVLQQQIRELRQQIATLDRTLGRVQSVRARVTEPGLRERLGESMELTFNSPDWIPARFGGKDLTVYLRGAYTTSAGASAEAPLLVKFPAGEGTVIFTAFHNEAQNSERERELLRYLVFTTVTAKEEALVSRTLVSGGFSPAKQSLLSHSTDNPSVTQTYRREKPGRLRFGLSFADQGARLRLTIVAPDGQKYEDEVRSSRVVEVPDAPVGQWHYTVAALQVPYENFPFSVSVGEESAPAGPPK